MYNEYEMQGKYATGKNDLHRYLEKMNLNEDRVARVSCVKR